MYCINILRQTIDTSIYVAVTFVMLFEADFIKIMFAEIFIKQLLFYVLTHHKTIRIQSYCAKRHDKAIFFFWPPYFQFITPIVAYVYYNKSYINDFFFFLNSDKKLKFKYRKRNIIFFFIYVLYHNIATVLQIGSRTI